MNTTPEEHFDGKIAQKVIVERAGKILLVQDPREKRDIWELPGGRMNVDEEPRAAINVHEVLHMEQFIQSNEAKRAFAIVYRATLVEEDALFKTDPLEVSKVAWFSAEDVGTLTFYPEHERAVQRYFDKH